jgi:hypothetical protein
MRNNYQKKSVDRAKDFDVGEIIVSWRKLIDKK